MLISFLMSWVGISETGCTNHSKLGGLGSSWFFFQHHILLFIFINWITIHPKSERHSLGDVLLIFWMNWVIVSTIYFPPKMTFYLLRMLGHRAIKVRPPISKFRFSLEYKLFLQERKTVEVLVGTVTISAMSLTICPVNRIFVPLNQRDNGSCGLW